MGKKKWGKPALVILIRGTPGEHILQACKTSSHSGPQVRNDGCFKSGHCQHECSTIATS